MSRRCRAGAPVADLCNGKVIDYARAETVSLRLRDRIARTREDKPFERELTQLNGKPTNAFWLGARAAAFRTVGSKFAKKKIRPTNRAAAAIFANQA